MGSLGEIPEIHARTAGQKQLTAWIKEDLLEHRRAEKIYALTPKGGKSDHVAPPRFILPLADPAGA